MSTIAIKRFTHPALEALAEAVSAERAGGWVGWRFDDGAEAVLVFGDALYVVPAGETNAVRVKPRQRVIANVVRDVCAAAARGAA